jgi:hypothetical protein
LAEVLRVVKLAEGLVGCESKGKTNGGRAASGNRPVLPQATDHVNLRHAMVMKRSAKKSAFLKGEALHRT